MDPDLTTASEAIQPPFRGGARSFTFIDLRGSISEESNRKRTYTVSFTRQTGEFLPAVPSRGDNPGALYTRV
jgi:hypothetical protein